MILRIIKLIHKDLRQFTRDRLLLISVLIGPTLLLLAVASTATSDTTDLPIAVIDLNKSVASRQLIAALDNLDELAVRYYLHDANAAPRLLDRGAIFLAVIIPPTFDADLAASGVEPTIQLLADGTNISAASTTVSAAEGAIRAFSQKHAYAPNESSGVDLRHTARYNPTLKGSYYLIPVQLALTVYIVTLLMAASGIVREMERGTMEQLMVTPLQKIELIVGKAIVPLVVAALDFLTMLVIVVFYFRVPFRGSFWLFCALTLLFIGVEVGLGLTISALSASQQQAVMYVFMLAIFEIALSGYLVPVENMPRFLQFIAIFSPVQHYFTVTRGVMLKAATLMHLRGDVIALVLLGFGSFVLTMVNLNKRLD